MAFRFDPPPAGGELRQGELLADVWVHRAVVAAAAMPPNAAPLINSTHHPFVLVLHADCDLLQDFNARREEAPAVAGAEHKNAIPQVLLCPAFTITDDFKRRVGASDLWKRVRQNQDERYQFLEFEAIAIAGAPASPLVVDFKKSFMVHTEDLYQGLTAGVRRMGVVPPVYVHDLMHRSFAYLSRVGLPE